jgi:hypothetical protein
MVLPFCIHQTKSRPHEATKPARQFLQTGKESALLEYPHTLFSSSLLRFLLAAVI